MTTDVARKKRAPTKKKIYDWAELNDMLTNPPKPVAGEVAETVREMAGRYFRHETWVQIGERLVIVATPTCITMHYAHTPPGESVGNTAFTPRVSVRPAAGGRTSYSFDSSVNGWFANRHLPINAKDRGTRSRYKHTMHYCGQGGVYQRGFGPWYPDAGPDCANESLEQFCGQLEIVVVQPEPEGDGMLPLAIPQEWCQHAAAFCQKVVAAVAPFKDCIVRFERYGYGAGAERRMNLCLQRGDNYCTVNSDYGVRVRVKLPNMYDDGRPVEVPDFVATMTGPLNLCEKDRSMWFTAQLLHPHGKYSTSEYSEHESVSTGLQHLLYPTPGDVIDAARQWAANHIYIPC